MSEEESSSHEIDEKVVEEKKQTQELKSILHNIDTDGAPQLLVKERELDLVSEEKVLDKLKLELSPLRGKESVPKEERPTGIFYRDMQIFFTQLGRAYENRYALWESSFASIMTILKKMRKFNEVQTNNLIGTIKELDQKLQKGLHDFEVKRDEMERFSDIDYKQVTQDFNKTMELLHLQIQEIQMRQEIDQLYKIYAN
ncbi:MAG: hypothetical protein ACTSYI_13885 [Promethearchaeota archaeon]